MKFDTIDITTEHKLDVIVSDIPHYESNKSKIIEIINNEVDPHNKKTNLKCHMTRWDMSLHPCFSMIGDKACELATSYTLLVKDHKRAFSVGALWGARYTDDEYAKDMIITQHCGVALLLLMV